MALFVKHDLADTYRLLTWQIHIVYWISYADIADHAIFALNLEPCPLTHEWVRGNGEGVFDGVCKPRETSGLTFGSLSVQKVEQQRRVRGKEGKEGPKGPSHRMRLHLKIDAPIIDAPQDRRTYNRRTSR